MPCTSSSGSKTTSVIGIPASIVLTVSPSPPWSNVSPNGTQITMTATIKDSAGNPVPGIDTAFTCSECEHDYGNATTNASGVATLTVYTGVFSACATYEVWAYCIVNSVALLSNKVKCGTGPCQGTATVTTRTSVLSPSSANAGATISVTAFVEYLSGSTWLPLPNASVSIAKSIDGGTPTTLGSGVTNALGQFSATDVVPSTPSSVVYTATFGGSAYSAGGEEGGMPAEIPAGNIVVPALILAIGAGLAYMSMKG